MNVGGGGGRKLVRSEAFYFVYWKKVEASGKAWAKNERALSALFGNNKYLLVEEINEKITRGKKTSFYKGLWQECVKSSLLN